MSTEFNLIRDTYHRNMFADDAAKIDVLALYQSLPDLAITGDQEENLYHLAARFTHPEAIKFLREKGVKPDTDKYGNTPLHALATAKFDLSDLKLEQKAIRIKETTQALLEAGVNSKKKNDSGKLAYYEAGLVYMYPMLDVLGDTGTKLDATEAEGKNLLHSICDKLVHRKSIPGALDAATKIVKVLIEKSGIDPDDKDIFGSTPLAYAQRSGVKEIAAILTGNDENTTTGGMTMHEAVLNRDMAALESIVKTEVDLDQLSDQHNRAALMLACEYPSLPMVKILTDAGADVNYRTGIGETAAYYLLAKGITNFGRGLSQDLKDIVKILRNLIDKGLDVDAAITNDGDTALNVICKAGYLADLNAALVEELIDAGADVNKPDQFGRTPLMSFAMRGNEPKYAIAELLLDNDADTTYVDNTGSTALMYAASNPDQMSAKKLVSLILDKDTSTIENVNNAGQTVMDVAIQNGNEAVVKQILA
ncbi:hypothetical protein FPZ42_14295 [Mucilaginibacter achroorhodeus]|uniref:Uncharacterized protein n=1 Tax=Mucilaginibacter achroorhodeus TaxID=2599294 RepID=A0A563TZV8_9SPHI|nr:MULTISPECIES: ankyrin repeat domain-containing protein [Mucilaginibacter]QXV65649.1 ankyrin repeat domain-containing protein [Mucilaginibacter sp. 21P]TWR24925.1 hypothetical protein FPZ42_14295 [Mucilaginibacter achroorhodeus]